MFKIWIFQIMIATSCIVLTLSCGSPTTRGYFIPETATPTQDTKQGLPESANVDLSKLPYVRNAFKESTGISKVNLDNFYATTHGKVQHIAIVSNSSFDILKAFVAKGWSPIVMIQFQGRTAEILPISDYNNQRSEVHLQNPTNLSKRRLTYTEFQTAWSRSSQNKCVLITPQKLTEKELQNVLGGYLAAEAFQQISIRSR